MVATHLERQNLLTELPRLVDDVRQLGIVLHHVLHDVGLVTLERKSLLLHFDDNVEQVEELRNLLLVQGSEVDDRLDLLGKNLQTRHLVANEDLQRQWKQRHVTVALIQSKTMETDASSSNADKIV